MDDRHKTKEHLISELEEMRQRVAVLEASETERKQMEEALRESEDKFRYVFDNSIIGKSITLPSGKVSSNKALSKMLGYSRKELDKLRWQDITHPDDIELNQKANDSLISGKKNVVRLLKRYIHKNGSIVWVDVSTSLRRDKDGKPLYFMTSIVDITEREKVEEVLRSSGKYFRALIENAQDTIVILNGDGTLRYASPSMERTWGYTVKDWIGKYFTGFVSPDDMQNAAEAFAKLLQNPSYLLYTEMHVRHKDGSIHVVEASGKNLLDNPSINGIVLSVRDITDRKKVEEVLRNERDNLLNTLNAMKDGVYIINQQYDIVFANPSTIEEFGPYKGKKCYEYFHDFKEPCSRCDSREVYTGKAIHSEWFLPKTGKTYDIIHTLFRGTDGSIAKLSIIRDITERKRMEEELWKIARLESIGTLAGGIAHDFNNLLTGIMGNISLAKRYIDPQGIASERLEEAGKASIRASDLTQQLLTFSRGGAPVKKVTSISGVIKESAIFVLHGSKANPVFSLPEELWTVEVDEGQIGQVIQNLVKNADEAMPEGGEIEINAENITVQAKSALPLSKGSYVKISVKDSGIGITKKNIARMFEPYFTTKQKGSGLGLATSYSIIKNHGGYISLDSTVGVGTTFYVYLPASGKQASTKKKEEGKIQPAFIGQGRVLVLDDEPSIRLLLQRMLTGFGYEVEISENGEQTIGQYTKARESGYPFDVVILDLTIPGGMGGKEVIKKLLEIDPQVKAIVSSGYSSDPIMAEYQKYGFSSVIAKPYSIAEMEKTLRSLSRKTK